MGEIEDDRRQCPFCPLLVRATVYESMLKFHHGGGSVSISRDEVPDKDEELRAMLAQRFAAEFHPEYA